MHVLAVVTIAVSFTSRGRALAPQAPRRSSRSSDDILSKPLTSLRPQGALLPGQSSTSRRNRRRALLEVMLPVSVSGLLLSQPSKALAAIEKVVQLTPKEAEDKFREGYKSITYLLDHYDEICEGGGDNVRRYLGTVVSNPPSGLVGISKTLRALEDRADDFVEYRETADEVIKSINQADGSSYMAIFVTTSTSYTPPQKYFDDAKIEVKRCIEAMKRLADLIDIKL